MYRLSKIGEGFNSLRNYITVQLNPGELKVVELIMDKASRDIVSGGVKALNTRIRVGRNWTYGLRAGGNVFINRETDEADLRRESIQFLGDLRTRANFDNVRYWGSSELVVKEIFGKERGRRYSVTSDEAQLETHFFPKVIQEDTVIVAPQDTITGGEFEVEPALDPYEVGEGLGVNVDFLSRYYLDASAQFGVAARQRVSTRSYAARTTAGKAIFYERARSVYEIGAETNLLAVLRLGDQATVDLRAEVFFPDGDPSRSRLVDITADSRVYLSRYVEIGYVFHLSESVEDVENRYPTEHSFSLRLSLNF
jgi:hypothetical protein